MRIWLVEGCTCGHDHRTSRGEPVELCLECACIEMIPRCQNCGQEATSTSGGFDVCSRRCALQLDHARTLVGGGSR